MKKSGQGVVWQTAAVLLVLVSVFFRAAVSSNAAQTATAEYTSAAECGLCHQSLYQSWRNTFHAQATVNPIFLNDLDAIDSSYGRGLRVLCLTCHSPTTILNMDYSLSKTISREGVTCDFCHTVVGIDLKDRQSPYENNLSPVKGGPGRADSRPAHQTRKNPIFLQAEFCAGCHQWFNNNGIAILDTYREWQSSPYKGEKISCQFCHMPEIMKADIMLDGNMVERPSHLHFEQGGHSQVQLATAAKLRMNTFVDNKTITARITVENFKGGHMLPSGLPSNVVVLEVLFIDTDGTLLERKETLYQRTIADADGQPLGDILSWYLKAASVLEDTRIAPKEKRVEEFTFEQPEDSTSLIVAANLFYRLNISSLYPQSFDYKMASTRMVVNGVRRNGGTVSEIFFIIVALIILIIIAFIPVKFYRSQKKDH